MNLIINYPKDKSMLEEKNAYIRAILIQKYINDLKIENKYKKQIKEELIKELLKT